jgi:two-component sensor histidine kinase/integral membrane sensor domain MASE1
MSELPGIPGHTHAIGAPQWPLPAIVPGFVLAYFVAAKVGILTAISPESITVLWPPNAILLATLLLVKPRQWWIFFVATIAAEIAADLPDYPLWAAASYGIVNFCEAATAATLLSMFTRNARSLEDSRDLLRFVAIGPFLAAGVAALFGAAIYKIGSPEIDYLHYWRVFWLGDALGLVVVGTTLLAWRRPADVPKRSGPHAALEAAVLALSLLAVAGWALLVESELPRVYLVFPFLVWAAVRFGVRGALLAIVTVTALAIGSALKADGPFTSLSHIDTVIALQGLVAVVALSTLTLAFSIEASSRATAGLRNALLKEQAAESELRDAYGQLESINRSLDAIVADRTKQLRLTVARNEMLLKEVHHRVKNNLQLISSLLSMQSHSEPGPELRRRLGEVQGQLRAIAATYEVLQQMESVEAADLCKVVPLLCGTIRQASGELASIAVEVSGTAMVAADTAVALSLALNELITNSIKHASRETAVAIAVSCRMEGEHVLLRVADEGKGFPPGFDIDRAQGFGMRMAHAMVKQAGGTIRTVDSPRGAVVEILATAIAPPQAPR